MTLIELDAVLALNEDMILARVFGFAVTINFEWVDFIKLIMNKKLIEYKVFYVWIYLCKRGLNNIFEAENQL